MSTLGERFWSKVKVGKPNDCWEWIAGKYHDGYGAYRTDEGKTRRAHRLSFAERNGEIAPGQWIDHMCFNRACVNPSHLRSGTPADNLRNLRGPQRNSTTGVRGVTFKKHQNLYCAATTLNSKPVLIGYFKTLEEADAAARAWRRENYPTSLMDQRKELSNESADHQKAVA